MNKPAYAALWCKSYGSFLEGASAPDELVESAHQLGLSGLALTDRDGLYGVVAAHVRAQELGLKLIIGAQITLSDERRLLLLAENQQGYQNLCQLISIGRRRSPKGQSQVHLIEVCQHAQGLLALWHDAISESGDGPFETQVYPLYQAFGDRLYALTTRHRQAQEQQAEQRLRERAQRWKIPVVAANEVLYHERQRRPLQDVLTCIRLGITVDRAGRKLRPNDQHALHSPQEFRQLFADAPRDVERTREVLARCQFSMAQLRYRYPEEKLPSGFTTQSHLEQLTWQGACRRYPDGVSDKVRQQLRKELDIIRKLDYGGYFLTLHHLVEYCQQQNILCQGRGSAANSAVCYCLGITAIDPVAMDLLFERFLSVERAEPPDIDLDIAHQDRERVIQYVYQLYGRDHAAMVANLVRYRPRSAIRDVGKALGLEPLFLERVARLLSHAYEQLPEDRLTEAGYDPSLPAHRHLMRLSREILGFPRHLSIHPGGFLLGHQPIHQLVPIENARMAGRTVIQWDKRDVEALGLFKVDLLALGALSQLKHCFRLIQEQHGRELHMANIPAGDGKTYTMLQRADAIGVFQVESRAQMTMLTRLLPKSYYDLVIQISIVRPGPISGGMVNPYLRRRCGQEEIVYPLPALEPILRKTCGVPLFQEQVIKLAMVAADYSGGEADQLRRDMGAWKSQSKIAEHKERLISRMIAKGIDPDFAERVFQQIQGFGEYGFPESHAASFALITYAMAYLKAHYPTEFCCALLNSQPMGFYSPLSIIEDARRAGVVFLPLHINRSQVDCTIEKSAIRMGLRYIKGVSYTLAERIVAQRGQGYPSLEELARRLSLEKSTLNSLARSGVFDPLGKSRRSQLWAAAGMTARLRDSEWIETEPEPDLPALTRAQTIDWDCRYTSHSLTGHPLSPWREQLRSLRLPDARQLKRRPHGSQARYAGLVICRQRPETARGVAFFTLEDETGMVNVVVRPELLERQPTLARAAGLLGVQGRLQAQEGAFHLLAERFFLPPLEHRDGLPLTDVSSRDFH